MSSIGFCDGPDPGPNESTGHPHQGMTLVASVTVIVQIAGLFILWGDGVDAWLWVSFTVNALGIAVCADALRRSRSAPPQ